MAYARREGKNDYASIMFWQADDCSTYNNTCITRIASCLKFTSETRGHLIANNIFVVDSVLDIPVIQSPFTLNENRFENNIYWRTGGKVSFRLMDAPSVELADAAAFFLSKNEIGADPFLSALSGPDIHPREGSPALGKGQRLENMGDRDLYGLPVGKTGAVNIGASLLVPKAWCKKTALSYAGVPVREERYILFDKSNGISFTCKRL